MTSKELKSILEAHHKYLANEDGGCCANLMNADLRRADLMNTNLRMTVNMNKVVWDIYTKFYQM